MQVVPRATAGSPLKAAQPYRQSPVTHWPIDTPGARGVFGDSLPLRGGRRSARPLRSASKRTKIDRCATQPTTPPGCCGQPALTMLSLVPRPSSLVSFHHSISSSFFSSPFPLVRRSFLRFSSLVNYYCLIYY